VGGLSDAEATKQRVADFLNRHTVYELLPESGKVVALDVTLPVKQAFHALYEQAVPSAPLWDTESQQFVGMLSASDFITILRQINSTGAVLSEEELETHTIAAWKEEKAAAAAAAAQGGARGRSRPALVSVEPDESLRKLADKLLEAGVATLPVLAWASQQEGGCQQLLHLASLSGVLKCEGSGDEPISVWNFGVRICLIGGTLEVAKSGRMSYQRVRTSIDNKPHLLRRVCPHMLSGAICLSLGLVFLECTS
jgi:hypothetical protein